MLKLNTDEMRGWFGLGVAGNIAGHLEQAGEAEGFAPMGTGLGPEPQGIFPFYVPGREGLLGNFPLSHDRLAKPASDEPVNLQIEPEAGLVLTVEYSDSGAVSAVVPVAVGAFNDCSVRRSDAAKISEKKNWGADSKGIASAFFEIDEIDPEGATAPLRLASYLRRGEDTYAYGIDTAVPDYSFYGNRLLGWIEERLNQQDGSPDGPLEPVGQYLIDAGRPGKMLAGIGATCYTDWGESNYLEVGDEAIVVIYDSLEHSPGLIAAAVAARREDELRVASLLCQTVYAAD